MAINIKQSMKLGQQLLMTPQLQQAIKLLQLSRMELQDFVSNQLAENPVLEEGQAESQEERIQVERERESSEMQAAHDAHAEAGKLVDQVSKEKPNEVDWEAYSKHQESAAPIPSTQMGRRDEDGPNYENIVTKAKTLEEYLLAQSTEIDFDEIEQEVASLIIGNIDEKGYFVSTVEDVSQSCGQSVDFVEDVLDTVQHFEPPGIAARDLKECLLIQLRLGRHRNGIVEKIVDQHLKELENRDFNTIAKRLGISLDQVIENVQIIAELEPVPGRQFGGETTQYVVPDVYVFKVSDEWVVSLNEEGIPPLRVNELYAEMLENSKASDTDKEYIQEKLKSATWLIKSLQQRQKTIYKVTECIVKRQRDFFEYGPENLKPMILKDIAEDISMHESTISRVTNNKYVHTPQGIFELKYFFNSSVSRADGNDLASASVKKMITDLIREENPKKPLSDQKIVDMLDAKGIQLARRTVAKYREQLNILPSSKRKKLF